MLALKLTPLLALAPLARADLKITQPDGSKPVDLSAESIPIKWEEDATTRGPNSTRINDNTQVDLWFSATVSKTGNYLAALLAENITIRDADGFDWDPENATDWLSVNDEGLTDDKIFSIYALVHQPGANGNTPVESSKFAVEGFEFQEDATVGSVGSALKPAVGLVVASLAAAWLI